MNNKLIILVVCAAFLVQCNDAATIKETNDVDPNVKAGQVRLTKFVFDELNKIVRMKMENSVKLAESVLNDPKVLEVNTDVMKSYLKDFQQFVEHWKKYGDKPLIPKFGSEEIMSEETALFKKYKNNNETKEAVIISRVLKEHGIDNQKELLQEPIMEYTNKFLPEAENYIRILNETKSNEKDIAGWRDLVKKIKSEKDAKKRGELIINYVTPFGIDTDNF